MLLMSRRLKVTQVLSPELLIAILRREIIVWHLALMKIEAPITKFILPCSPQEAVVNIIVV